jgi:hypothetical protein
MNVSPYPSEKLQRSKDANRLNPFVVTYQKNSSIGGGGGGEWTLNGMAHSHKVSCPKL